MKNVLIFEKKGGADAFENDPPIISKPTVGMYRISSSTSTAVVSTGTVPLLINEGSFLKASAPPFFSKMRTFFKNRLRWFHSELNSPSRKRGGADFFSAFVWWVVWAESPIQI